MTQIATITGSLPITCAQGRHGEAIITQQGMRPLRWAGSGQAIPAGLDPPGSAPGCTLDQTPHYHIARIDVAKPGAVYYAPPEVTLSGGNLDPQKGRACKAKSYLSQASVNEILVEDGGKYYAKVPNVELSGTHGQGAQIVASTGVQYSDGISQWELTGGALDQDEVDRRERTRFPLVQSAFIALPIEGNGTFSISAVDALNLYAQRNYYRHYFRTNDTPSDYRNPPSNPSVAESDLLQNGYVNSIRYTVSGYTGTSRAIIAIKGSDQYGTGGVSANGSGYRHTWGCSGVSEIAVKETGGGFDQSQAVTVTIEATFGIDTALVIDGYPSGHPLNSETAGRPIRTIEVTNSGNPDRPYVITPQLQIVSDTGFGGFATCTISDGAISSVTLENSGGGYKSDPEVRILSGGAEASVVARPHLRGLYQCYYRYIDDTPEDSGGPMPSNLSDVTEVDAGEASTSISWAVATPSGRAKKVELWRTTGNQALTLYRVATLTPNSESGSTLTYLDDLTDEELRNPDRSGYEAMPIVLPNGELNAMRFVPPPNKSVVVRFQDRFWYGVGGENPNAIYFSEIDEPESVPKVNEIIPQQSGRGADTLTALVPFGTTLLLMQKRHCYSLTFARQPLLDAQVAPIAYRGCINQRTWDIHDGVLFAMDTSGIYAMSGSGQVNSLSDAVEDQFREKINWSASRWCFLTVDHSHKVLRAFVSHKDDADNVYPTRALCYSLDSQGWWYEIYPQRITGVAQAALTDGEYRSVYAADSGAVLLDEGSADLARGTVLSVVLTSQGSGYKKPPLVQAIGGRGARFQATLDGSGRVKAIWILSGGSGYESGDLVIAAPESPGGTVATATFTASSLTEDTPVSPLCQYKSGFAPYPTDDDDQRLGGEQDRSVSLLYAPQPTSTELSVRTYYNGSKSPRPNLVDRDRGTGVRQDTIDPAARIDIGESLEEYGEDVGVAKAMFSGRALADFRGNDRHIAAEIIGPRRSEEPLVLYQLQLFGAQK